MTNRFGFVKALMVNKTDQEIEERLVRLRKIGRGPGNPMHDDLTQLLKERREKH